MQEVTLGDFITQLTVRMEDANLVMLFKDEAPWHLLFYKLKTISSHERPDFLQRLRFDWDGPYPRSQELSEFLQALHWTGSVVAANPSYDKITLQRDVRELWIENSERLSSEVKSLLTEGIEIAKQEFPSTVSR